MEQKSEGLHYHELDILDRLESATKVNGAHPKDIADAITEIKRLRDLVKRYEGNLPENFSKDNT